MNLSFFISKRYLFSRKSHNAINIITAIAVSGIAVGSMALVIVLSGFNGLEDLVEGMYNSFDADLKITKVKGKTFEANAPWISQIEEINEVAVVGKSIEETALVKYKDQQSFARVKGVSDNFPSMIGLDSSMYEGDALLERDDMPMAILGYGIADKLNVFTRHIFEPLVIFAAKRKAKISVDPSNAFRSKPIGASGIFSITPDLDYQYIIVPIWFAEEVFDYTDRLSALEINLKQGVDHEAVRQNIQSLVGQDYVVKTRYELNEVIYQTNKTEKWITFMILTFILIIATFNVIGSLTILILDKRGDIHVLRSMGASKKLIRKIFLSEGLMISLAGGLLGLLIGFLLTLGQQEIGFVELGVPSVTQYYPVKMELPDFVAILITVVTLGLIAAWLPVKFVLRKI